MRMARSELEYQVDAVSAGLVDSPAVPVGVVAVVEACVEAQADGALQLFLAAGDSEYARTFQPRELQRKDGDAAGSLDEDRASRHDVAGSQRVPGRDGGAGQRGSLLKAEMAGHLDEAVLIQDHLFGEHAVDIAA
jgi:hypothetical protein